MLKLFLVHFGYNDKSLDNSQLFTHDQLRFVWLSLTPFSVCPSLCLSHCLPLFNSISLSLSYICHSIPFHLSVYLSNQQFLCLYLCVFISFPLFMTPCISVYMSVLSCLCLSYFICLIFPLSVGMFGGFTKP